MNILIAEDELVERLALEKTLRRIYGDKINDIYLCKDGKEAVTFARERQVDIVFMDIHMPKLSGIEASKQIRTFNESVEIIMVTAYADFEYAQQSLQNRASDYIVKPYSVATLQKNIDAIFAKYQTTQEIDETGKNNPFIQQAKRYINANYDKDISLDQIATNVGISKFYLSRLFKQVEETNLKDYILSIKIEHAKEMLRNGARVSEVSDKLSFSDSSYFTKCFKKIVGSSPRAFFNQNHG